MPRAAPAEASSRRPVCVLPPICKSELLQSSPPAVTPIASAWFVDKQTHQRLTPSGCSLRSLPVAPLAPKGQAAGPATGHRESSSALRLSDADHHVDQEIIVCLKKTRSDSAGLDLWHRFTANSCSALIYAGQTSQIRVRGPAHADFGRLREKDTLCATSEKESAMLGF